MNETNNKIITCIGYKPFAWQKYVHCGISKFGKGTGHIHCVKAKRQIGKSYIIINELLRFSLNYKNITNGCLSPTLSQSRKIYRDILKACDGSGVISKKNDSLLEIHFINGSQILFKSAEQRDALRGYTYDGILCIDEAAYINDEVYSLIKPSTDVWRCPILMVSTPRFRMGFFYENYTLGLLPKNQRLITSYDLTKFDTSALLSAEALEMYKQMLPKNQFITEYLGNFLDSDSVVFGDFKSCISNNYNKNYKELYIGIDWGSGVGKDETVICGLNEFNQQVLLEHFNNKNTTEQIDYIYQYLKPFFPKIKNILCENNGIGKPMVEHLKKKFVNHKNIKINEFVTSNSSKASLVSNLQVAFQQNNIQILDNDQQTAELQMYEAKFNQYTNVVTYNAPSGGNDDMCIALMLSMQSKNKKNNGSYSISFL